MSSSFSMRSRSNRLKLRLDGQVKARHPAAVRLWRTPGSPNGHWWNIQAAGSAQPLTQSAARWGSSTEWTREAGGLCLAVRVKDTTKEHSRSKMFHFWGA